MVPSEEKCIKKTQGSLNLIYTKLDETNTLDNHNVESIISSEHRQLSDNFNKGIIRYNFKHFSATGSR